MSRVIYYAGIGSRKTPSNILTLMQSLAKKLATREYALRSGGAEGADTAFETGCDAVSGQKSIFIPWDGFNDRFPDGVSVHSLSHLDNLLLLRVRELVQEYHPNFKKLSEGSIKLHSRNVFQVLGLSLQTPSSFVVCWTPEADGSGGTGMAIRLAKHYEIPVFDLADPSNLKRVERFL